MRNQRLTPSIPTISLQQQQSNLLPLINGEDPAPPSRHIIPLLFV